MLIMSVINPPFLHIIAWSVSKLFPHTHTAGLSGIDQSYLKCNASRNSLFFRSKPISFRGTSLSQLDEPFSCDNSIALRKEGDTVSKRSSFDFC